MAVVNKFNVNREQVTLDADIIENMSANDVSYDYSTQYDENTVGDKLSELGKIIEGINCELDKYWISDGSRTSDKVGYVASKVIEVNLNEGDTIKWINGNGSNPTDTIYLIFLDINGTKVDNWGSTGSYNNKGIYSRTVNAEISARTAKIVCSGVYGNDFYPSLSVNGVEMWKANMTHGIPDDIKELSENISFVKNEFYSEKTKSELYGINNIVPLSEGFTVGGLNDITGAETTTTSRLRSGFIKVDCKELIKLKFGEWACEVLCYNTNKEYIGYRPFTYVAEGLLELPTNTLYIRFLVKHDTITAPTASDDIALTMIVAKPTFGNRSIFLERPTLHKIRVAQWNIGLMNYGSRTYSWVNGNDIIYTTSNPPSRGNSVFDDMGNKLGTVDTYTNNKVTFNNKEFEFLSSVGTIGIPEHVYDLRIKEIRNIIADLSPDILIINEHSVYADRNMTLSSYDEVFKYSFPYKVETDTRCAVFSKYPIFLTTTNTSAGVRQYYHGYMTVNGIKIGLVALHAGLNITDKLDNAREYVSKMADYDIAIMAGDTNIGNSASETEDDIRMQMEAYAGYIAGNRSRFGDISTNNEKALDNIFVKGCSIDSFKVYKEKSVSDHYPTYSDITIFT